MLGSSNNDPAAAPTQAEDGKVPNCKGGSSALFLTWEDLCVMASDRKGRRGRPILHGATGYAQPGELLAVMGPSGCGKSTLLDALAGRSTAGRRQSGKILVNGRQQTLAFGTSAYVTQDDILTTTLTVREAVHYSSQLQLPDEVPLPEKKERAEEVIREMGLQEAADTRVGGAAAGGLSGGQKRRLSICLEILTRPRLLFLDEPTSGIDSAASYHVMRRIARLARGEGMTVVAAVHQPCGDVFELFHCLCLLSDGRTVYFGPPSAAGDFFAMNGFPCPLKRNPSDHYLRTINKDFGKVERILFKLIPFPYPLQKGLIRSKYTDKNDIEEGDGGKWIATTEAINILVECYQSSGIRQQVIERIKEFCKMVLILGLEDIGGTSVEERSHSGFVTQALVLTRRSFVNMSRDLGYYWLRFMIYFALCLCLGTIFHNAGNSYDSIQARGTMLMFIVSFLTFMAIGGFPSFVEDVKIFQRERLNGHYGVLAFVASNTVSSAPYLALISIIPGATTYYLADLQKGIQHFIYFSLMLFTCMMLVESLMMIVTAIVPDFLMGIITGAGIQGVMMLNSGFFRLPRYLPKPVWRYPMFYIAFHRYANQGLCKNEFLGSVSHREEFGTSYTLGGEEILRDVWDIDASSSKWVDLVILFGMLILYRFLFLIITMICDRIKPMMMRTHLQPPPSMTNQIRESPSDACSRPWGALKHLHSTIYLWLLSTSTVAMEVDQAAGWEEEKQSSRRHRFPKEIADLYHVSLLDFPGGTGAFETAAKFCYGVPESSSLSSPSLDRLRREAKDGQVVEPGAAATICRGGGPVAGGRLMMDPWSSLGGSARGIRPSQDLKALKESPRLRTGRTTSRSGRCGCPRRTPLGGAP
ncbi:hypothetical protein Taro_013949 [Colocasia esculenta]|uniref:ABC transporter domain-containing protein n=1 Tax=Colocasia esculenta TaxID=4460 RepID=A0A843UGY0_COLES|nr:hypothetical protein [Colocasia esculenta]